MASNDPTFVVIWPHLAAPVPGNEERVLSRGDVLPADLPASTIQALVSAGAVRLAASGSPASGGRGGAEGGDGRPAKAAKVGEWEAYAVAQGVDAAVAKAATKAQLVAHFYDGVDLPGETPAGTGTVTTPGAGDGDGDDAEGDSSGSGSGDDDPATPPAE